MKESYCYDSFLLGEQMIENGLYVVKRDILNIITSLGGDCDTLTCISGSIAEAFYEIPKEIADEGLHRISSDLRSVLNKFYSYISK